MSSPLDGMDPEFRAWVFGKRLGKGVDREVYEWNPDKELVCKVCIGEYDFQNVAEWMTWQASSEELAKFLRPLYRISPSGRYLLAYAAEPCPASLIPQRVPRVLQDLHDDNWGWYEGRPVVMDYGRNLAMKMSLNAQAAKRLVKIGVSDASS